MALATTKFGMVANSTFDADMRERNNGTVVLQARHLRVFVASPTIWCWPPKAASIVLWVAASRSTLSADVDKRVALMHGMQMAEHRLAHITSASFVFA